VETENQLAGVFHQWDGRARGSWKKPGGVSSFPTWAVAHSASPSGRPERTADPLHPRGVVPAKAGRRSGNMSVDGGRFVPGATAATAGSRLGRPFSPKGGSAAATAYRGRRVTATRPDGRAADCAGFLAAPPAKRLRLREDRGEEGAGARSQQFSAGPIRLRFRLRRDCPVTGPTRDCSVFFPTILAGQVERAGRKGVAPGDSTEGECRIRGFAAYISSTEDGGRMRPGTKKTLFVGEGSPAALDREHMMGECGSPRRTGQKRSHYARRCRAAAARALFALNEHGAMTLLRIWADVSEGHRAGALANDRDLQGEDTRYDGTETRGAGRRAGGARSAGRRDLEVTAGVAGGRANDGTLPGCSEQRFGPGEDIPAPPLPKNGGVESLPAHDPELQGAYRRVKVLGVLFPGRFGRARARRRGRANGISVAGRLYRNDGAGLNAPPPNVNPCW